MFRQGRYCSAGLTSCSKCHSITCSSEAARCIYATLAHTYLTAVFTTLNRLFQSEFTIFGVTSLSRKNLWSGDTQLPLFGIFCIAKETMKTKYNFGSWKILRGKINYTNFTQTSNKLKKKKKREVEAPRQTLPRTFCAMSQGLVRAIGDCQQTLPLINMTMQLCWCIGLCLIVPLEW